MAINDGKRNLSDDLESFLHNLKSTTTSKKIPGEIPPLPKKSSQGYIEDLSQKQVFELQELLERQNKILANKHFVSKLPDKGAKIINFKKQIENELAQKKQVERASELFSKLNIAVEGKAAVSKMEWTGKCEDGSKAEKVVELDSDDDEDPLKVLAQPTGSGTHKKKITYLAPEENLITPSDLEDIESFKKLDPLELEHVKYIVSKVENPDNKVRVPFKPYFTTKSNVHDPEKQKNRKLGKYWEEMAAAPPPIIHDPVKVLDLTESLKLQKENENKLKEIQTKYATERLMQQIGKHNLGDLPTKHFQNYRVRKDSESSVENEYEEVYDDEDHDKGGTVTYPVDSETS